MKKHRKFWILIILCMIVCSLKTVNASELALENMKSNEINYISNNFSMNLPYQITYGGQIATHNATRITTLVNRQQGGPSTFYGPGNFKDNLFIASADKAGYYLYRMDSADSYITAYYTNVGRYIGDGKNEPVNCVMTISNFRAGNTPLYGKLGYIGFCDKGLAWILLNDGTAKLNADVEVYFYFANDPTRTPIDLGEAYIGIGGMNSEKRVYNTGNVDNNKVAQWASIPSDRIKDWLDQNNPGANCGVQGAQWEWVSYDSNVVDSLKAFYISDLCAVKYVNEGAKNLEVKDEDTVLGAETLSIYTWGYNSGNTCTFNFKMDNPTGHNVISNAGMCFDSSVHADISEFTNYKQFSSNTIKRQCYMVEVARITDSSAEDDLVYSGGRTDGKPYSVYKFVGGKDVGSVEMALYPVSICNEVSTPKKTVNRTIVHEQEEIIYTVKQTIGNMKNENERITQQKVYDSFVFTDNLPSEVELTYAIVKDGKNNTVAEIKGTTQTSGNSNCTLSYNPSTNAFVCNFKEGYLTNTMEYIGETYTFQMVTKVRDVLYDSNQDFIAKNKGKITFDNTYDVYTNEVSTQILYDILTKGVHTIISDMITDIKGGEDGKTVTFTPELGYYVETVEWQTQSKRYDIPNITDIPNENKVTIPETKDGSENTYKHETTMTGNVPEDEKDTLNYDPFGQTTFTFNDVDNNHYIKVISKPMKMVINISKEDSVTGKETQGDATFEGAEYTIYSNEGLTEFVETVTLDEEGYGSSTELPLGKYWIKETKAPDGYLLDEEVYTVEQTAEVQTAQRLKVSYHDITSYDEIIKGRVIVVKYDEIPGVTEDVPSAGAILKLALDSNPEEYYLVTLDEDGNGEFYNPVLEEFAPYTIPYGKYTLSEVKESDEGEGTHYFIQPTPVDLTDGGDEEIEYRIVADIPVPMRLHIIKTDAVTGAIVTTAGAKFKIWNCQTEDWVKQTITYPSFVETEVFETNENGDLYTPQKLYAGEYIVYEVEAPEGYLLNPDWAIPENEADWGNPAKGGKYVKVDKVAMGISNDTAAADLDLYYDVKMPNEPLKGKLEITKTGEVLSDVTISAIAEDLEKYTPVYVQAALPGVTYDIIAAQDIKSPDGNHVYVTAGTKVATITTDENGVATTPDLFLGEYKIVETSVPAGYIIDNDIENVVLTNETKDVAVETTEVELVNPRQKLKLTFKKEFEDIEFEFDGEIKATFGVYANQDIKNNAGEIIIPKDSLVDLIEYTKGEEDDVTSSIDLPQGKYYVRELEVSFPYTKCEEKREVELLYTGTKDEFVTYSTDKMVNTYNSTTISLLKLPTTVVENIIVSSEGVDETEFEQVTAEIIEQIKVKTNGQIKEYFAEMGWQGLEGAEYSVYIDAECQKPLKMKNENGEFVEAKLVSDELGMMVLEDIPVGVYYLKETKAPAKYEITEEPIKIETTLQDKDSIAYRVVKEDSVIAAEIQKVDIFTGESVPNCVFEIYDENGKVLMHSVTDDQGVGHIAANLFEDGKTYIFKEIDAPAQYKINTEPQEFVAQFDENGKWISDKVTIDNTRKNIEELIVRKVDDETGEPLQGCKFSIIVLDENGEPVLDENGEYVYLVKEAVTDENGEYIVDEPYYGYYQFIEVEAPEGYELKVDMEGMTFVIDENSPETVIFEVTNTGDIQVIALTVLALVSVLGIAYVVRKNKLAVK